MSGQRVVFVDEPPPIGGPEDPRAIWIDRLRPLVERPGEWAEVYSGTASACHGAAQSLRLRQYFVPPGAWDFTVRSFRRRPGSAINRDPHARAVLYARFLGANEEPWRNYSETYAHAGGAVWDQYGRRICPVCEKRALIKGDGPYPSMCDPCGDATADPALTHGRETTYRKKGCRCRACRFAASHAQRERAQAKKVSP